VRPGLDAGPGRGLGGPHPPRALCRPGRRLRPGHAGQVHGPSAGPPARRGGGRPPTALDQGFPTRPAAGDRPGRPGRLVDLVGPGAGPGPGPDAGNPPVERIPGPRRADPLRRRPVPGSGPGRTRTLGKRPAPGGGRLRPGLRPLVLLPHGVVGLPLRDTACPAGSRIRAEVSRPCAGRRKDRPDGADHLLLGSPALVGGGDGRPARLEGEVAPGCVPGRGGPGDPPDPPRGAAGRTPLLRPLHPGPGGPGLPMGGPLALDLRGLRRLHAPGRVPAGHGLESARPEGGCSDAPAVDRDERAGAPVPFGAVQPGTPPSAPAAGGRGRAPLPRPGPAQGSPQEGPSGLPVLPEPRVRRQAGVPPGLPGYPGHAVGPDLRPHPKGLGRQRRPGSESAEGAPAR